MKAPPGAMPYIKLRELIDRAQRGEVFKLYYSLMNRQDQPIFVFDLDKRTGFRDKTTIDVFHYPENAMGFIKVEDFDGFCKSPSPFRKSYIFDNYWHAYAHMLREKAKEAKEAK
jgi:hypothetical protein